MRPLTEGKLQAESVRRHAGAAVRKGERKEKNEKKKKSEGETAKYIEASTSPVRNGVGEVRKRATAIQRAAGKDEKH